MENEIFQPLLQKKKKKIFQPLQFCLCISIPKKNKCDFIIELYKYLNFIPEIHTITQNPTLNDQLLRICKSLLNWLCPPKSGPG